MSAAFLYWQEKGQTEGENRSQGALTMPNQGNNDTVAKKEMSDKLALIPQGISFVSVFRPNKLVRNPALTNIYNAFVQEFYPSELPLAEEGVAKLKEESGFDPEAFSELLVLGDLSSREYWGGIGEGNFVEKRLITEVEKARDEKFDLKDYKGYRIYADGRDEFWICFLSKGRLALGFKEMVEDVIEVEKGEKEHASGDMYETSALLEEELVKVSLEVPERARNWLREKTQWLTEFSIELPLDISRMGIVLSGEGDLLRVQVQVYYPNHEKAQDLVEVVEGLKRIAIAMIRTSEINELLRRMDANTSDSSVMLLLEVPTADLTEFIKKGKEFLRKVFK